MVDQSQLTLDRLFESVLQVCRMSHLPKSLFGPVTFADLPRMSLLYDLKDGAGWLSYYSRDIPGKSANATGLKRLFGK